MMPDRLQALEKIVAIARYVRQLERGLVDAKDARLMVDRLYTARRQLDEALEELDRLERD